MNTHQKANFAKNIMRIFYSSLFIFIVAFLYPMLLHCVVQALVIISFVGSILGFIMGLCLCFEGSHDRNSSEINSSDTLIRVKIALALFCLLPIFVLYIYFQTTIDDCFLNLPAIAWTNDGIRIVNFKEYWGL